MTSSFIFAINVCPIPNNIPGIVLRAAVTEE